MIGFGLAINQPQGGGLEGAIRALFANGEQGAVYDPSDFSTLYQDSTGATPVTAVEQPVGRMHDKRFGLILGPAIPSSTTGDTVIEPSAAFRWYWPLVSLTSGMTYEISVPVVAVSGGVACTLDWCDVNSHDLLPVAGTVHKFYARRDTYDATYRFLDIFTSPGMTLTIGTPTIRELPGNHAVQATAASRPVLSARLNQMLSTEDFSTGSWQKLNSGTGSAPVLSTGFTAPDGTSTAVRLQANKGAGGTASDYSLLQQPYINPSTTATMPAASSVWIKSNTGASQNIYCRILLDAYQVVTPEWTEYKLSATASASAVVYVSVGARATSDNSVDILIWHPHLEVGTNVARYQRVNTATDYDTVGFPHYLRCDGIDDGMATAAIDFTATDAVTIWAGLRKLSDAASAGLLEISADTASNAGTFRLTTPGGGGLEHFTFYSRGSVTTSAGASVLTGYAAPVTSVLTAEADISTDLMNLRVDGQQKATQAGDQGIGNYGSFILYLFRRGGTTLPFNGHFYGAIIRGAASTAAQVATGELYIGNKTGVTLP